MKLPRICLLLCCISLVVQFLIPSSGFSEKLYTWTDKSGKVRRTYYPPPDEYVQKSKSSKQETRRQTAQQNQVELYVTSWCPYCKKAKQFFNARGIPYKAYDIEKDAQAATRKQQLDSKSGVPFAVVNGVRIHGYKPKRYSKALK